MFRLPSLGGALRYVFGPYPLPRQGVPSKNAPTAFPGGPDDTPQADDSPRSAPASPPWFEWAAGEIGFHERGENQGIERYIQLAHCGELGDPWCAIFANAALERSGFPGTRSPAARSFEHSGRFVRLAGPAIGAVTTMWRGSPSSGLGHVFFYAGENGDNVLALGGNQDDQVCRQWEPKRRIVGYYWPASSPLPKVGKVIVNSKGTRTGSEV